MLSEGSIRPVLEIGQSPPILAHDAAHVVDRAVNARDRLRRPGRLLLHRRQPLQQRGEIDGPRGDLRRLQPRGEPLDLRVLLGKPLLVGPLLRLPQLPLLLQLLGQFVVPLNQQAIGNLHLHRLAADQLAEVVVRPLQLGPDRRHVDQPALHVREGDIVALEELGDDDHQHLHAVPEDHQVLLVLVDICEALMVTVSQLPYRC